MRDNSKDKGAVVSAASARYFKRVKPPLTDVSMTSEPQTKKHQAKLREQNPTQAFDLKQVNANVFAMPSGGDLELIDASGELPVSRGTLPVKNSAHPLADELTLMAEIGKTGILERLVALTGLGRWHGAAAVSAKRNGKIVVFGHNPDDLAVAVNAVIKAGGGLAVTSGAWINALVKQKDMNPAETEHTEASSQAMRMAQKALDDIVDRRPPLLLERLMKENFAGALQPQAETGIPLPFAADLPRKPSWQPPHAI